MILPVYNVEKYLLICLKSILNETYQNIQLIYVDDDSNCGQIKKYAVTDKRILIIPQQNQGLSGARNMSMRYIHKNNWPFEYKMVLDNRIILLGLGLNITELDFSMRKKITLLENILYI